MLWYQKAKNFRALYFLRTCFEVPAAFITSNSDNDWDDGMNSTSQDDSAESASEYKNTKCESKNDNIESIPKNVDTECVSENDSIEIELGIDSIKPKSIVSSSLKRHRIGVSKGQKSSHSKSKTSVNRTWIPWTKHFFDPNEGLEPVHAITTKSFRIPIDQCDIDSTSDSQIKNDTTINNTNKRARGPKNNDSHRRKAKTAKHERFSDLINDSSMFILEFRSIHVADIESFRVLFVHDQGIIDTTTNTLNNIDVKIIISDALDYSDDNIAQFTKFFGVDLENALQIPASDMQMLGQVHIEISTANNDNSIQIMKELAFNADTATAFIDKQNLQYTNNVNRPTLACTGARPETSNAFTNDLEASVRAISTDISLTANAFGGALTRKMSYKGPQISRWKSTPFTLRPVENNLYCSRLIVNAQNALTRILPPKNHSLDLAVNLIHRHKLLRKSMCCETSRIFTVYDEIHRMDFADPVVTLLNSILFKPFYCQSHAEQTAFHKKIAGWIYNVGHGIRIYHGIWIIRELLINYEHLELFLCLVKDDEKIVYSCPSSRDDPTTEEIQLEVSF